MSRQDQGEIYMLTNKTTGKRYVGQTVSYLSSGRKSGTMKRWERHLKSAKKNNSQPICEAIRHFGKDDFMIEVLLYCNLKDLDHYEQTFIKTFDTLIPRGYNVMKGGNLSKRLHERTKEIISEQKRFLYVSEEDRKKIEVSMTELGIEKIPSGIVYLHNTNQADYKEGFVVSIDDGKKKSFTIGTCSLTEKLRLAFEYYNYYINKDIENMKRMDDEMEVRTKQRLSDMKRLVYVSENDKIKIEKCLTEVGIDKLPPKIRYTHNTNRENFEGFVVHLGNKKTKTFSSAKTLTDNLRLALEYQGYFLKNDVENMKKMDEDTKRRHTLRSRSVRYPQEALNALKQLNIDIMEVPLEIHYRTIPSSEFFVIHNKNRIFFTRDDPMKSLEECVKYLNNIKN